MKILSGRRVILGISGGIAAYKCAGLVRRLRDQGAQVRVVMTDAAMQFITPLTLQALSGNPVSSDLFDSAAEAAMGHIELGQWADLVILAPATADLIARIAAGMANDLVTALSLATAAPVAIVPAMNGTAARKPIAIEPCTPISLMIEGVQNAIVALPLTMQK